MGAEHDQDHPPKGLTHAWWKMRDPLPGIATVTALGDSLRQQNCNRARGARLRGIMDDSLHETRKHHQATISPTAHILGRHASPGSSWPANSAQFTAYMKYF
ncbi:uncharacterized protein PHACADRAFT_250832 [Phanerochaete carnosa HHB-10118-sp]|uniref:Uncharacterized protein n=1 Tax=Phanerochaete carnosa (strain HHB-10118-sp) TaxID=650164 RepID=K5VAV0_PHACS|nr:uncharacterized protein PHACADRAFT_250832 [Phanerochaete carnosa HHB-10118-sp]EKM59996.1 hypothetical protein PHACADRAFT_250832 [Phanerochaete carnosa HHB-10118-sp]